MKQFLFSALIIFCTISVTAQTTVGLIGYWPFSGNYTNTGSAPATASGVNTGFTTGFGNVPNAAVQFQGNTGSYIDFIDNGNFDFVGTNNFTVAFSFFFNGSSTSGLVDNCLNYGGWGVWLWSTVSGTWNLQFNYKNNSVGSAAATNFPIGTWHHATAVRNNGTISLYVDGILRLSATEGTTAPSYPINMQAGAMCYGGFNPPRYNPFGGKIDELRIYNRALTAAEILILASVTLPVKLTSFTAVNSNSNIKLQWQTQYEQNSSHYNIQRSTDGINFTNIARVNAAGNSNIPLSYSHTDLLSAMLQNIPTVFYRLQSVDIDGLFSNSKVVAVHLNKTGMQLFVSPNPAKDVLQVQTGNGLAGNATLMITDAMGRQLYKKDISLQQGSNTIPVNISLLSSGIYYVRLTNANESFTKQFLKE
jgi:Concanavalin A-like lectin/glucanases superfamily/Secretion system C-terminal sorting domain